MCPNTTVYRGRDGTGLDRRSLIAVVVTTRRRPPPTLSPTVVATRPGVLPPAPEAVPFGGPRAGRVVPSTPDVDRVPVIETWSFTLGHSPVQCLTDFQERKCRTGEPGRTRDGQPPVHQFP